MKPPHLPVATPRPRLLCRVIRQWSALGGTAFPRHAHTCADCQKYFRAANSLEAELRQAGLAASRLIVPSDTFERRIVNGVRTSRASSSGAAQRQGTTRLWISRGAIAAGLVVALVLFNRPSDQAARIDETAVATITAADAKMIVDAVDSFSTKLTTVIPRAGALVASNPLQQELDAVYADARSALDFLALNFLPRAPETNRPEEAPPRTG